MDLSQKENDKQTILVKGYGNSQKTIALIESELDSQISERLDKIEKFILKSASYVDENGFELYDKIHKDIDLILLELNLTIEYLRVNGTYIENTNSNENDEKICNDELSKSKKDVDLKKKEIADVCRQFVNDSKNMISSSFTNYENLNSHIIQGLNSLYLLIRNCLLIAKINAKHYGKFYGTKTVLSQLLSLINSYRGTINIASLVAQKQLKEISMNLLVKQASSLADEISMLIKCLKSLV